MKHILLYPQSSTWFKVIFASVNNINRLFVFSIFLSALPVSAQQINCNYPVKELSEICQQYDESNIIIHNEVSETGLNDLVSSWTEPGKLHLIPAKRYHLKQPLDLPSELAILPLPFSVDDKAPTMISLSWSHEFIWTSHFTTLVLNDGNRIGWISIDGNDFFSSRLPDEEDKSTLVTINSPNTELSASLLHGDSGGRLKQLVTINTRGHSEPGQTLLSRNQFQGSDNPVLINATQGENQSLVVKNNMLDMLSYGSTGIKLASGSIQVMHNDFLFSDNCGECSALNLQDAEAFTINNNMFWQEYPEEDDQLVLSIGAPDSTKSQGFIIANSLSPQITLTNLDKWDDRNVYQIVGNNYNNALSEPYPLKEPEKFFAFTGNLGNTPIPGILLPDIQQYAPTNNNVTDLSALQQPAIINASGFINFSLLAEAKNHVSNCSDYCHDASAATSFSSAGAAGMLVSLGGFAIANIITFTLCWRFGKTKRPDPGFQRMDPAYIVN